MEDIDNNIHSPQADRNAKRKIIWDLEKPKNQVKQMSPAEILQKRKERFGELSPPKPKYTKISHRQTTPISSSSDDALQKRRERFSASVAVVDINVLKKRSERFGESASALMKKLDDKDKLKLRAVRFSSSTPTVPITSNKSIIFGPPPNDKLFKTIDQIEAEEEED